MQRYFVNEKVGNSFFIAADDSYHIIKVMRMQLKDKIEIVFQDKLFLCEIVKLSPNVKCDIVKEFNNEKLILPKVSIAQSLVKEQKMDYILQKSTELGVYEIIPMYTERSIIKVKDKYDKKIERWKKVVKEASEQSKRFTLPYLNRIIDLKELIKEKYDFKFICSVNEKTNVNEKTKTIKNVLSNVNINDTILFVIGPEGGFSEKEEKLLVDNGFQSITLGENILRTETSSAFILSVINYHFMR